MKKSNRLTVLPTQLIEDLDSLNLSKIQINKSIQLLDILKQKSLNKFGGGFIFGISTLSSNYFRDVFSSRYLVFLKPLIEKGIIIQDISYNVERGIAKGYSINRKYENNMYLSPSLYSVYNNSSTYTPPTITDIIYTDCYTIFKTLPLQGNDGGQRTKCKNYKNKENKMVNYTVKLEAKEGRAESMFLSKFKQDFKTLSIDAEKLTKITVNKLAKLSISDFNVNEEIEAPAVKVEYRGKWIYLKTVDAIDLAKEEGKSLIQDKGNYYMENETNFLTRKVNNIYNSYSEVITKLDKKYYYANRNFTNNRLDTNITSMCSEFMQVIKEDNDLVELDMANSQFAILSHILPDLDTIDYRLFKALSFSGELYGYIKTKLNLDTLKEAKNITFQVLFGKENQRTQGIKDFSELFPSVLKWINSYKTENGYKDFSVMLQKEEAKIFVDEIYKEIKREKLFCLTKHDSLIIRRDDLEEVQEIVDEYFDSICFEGTLRAN